MEPNKGEDKDGKKGPCCHCCDKCHPRDKPIVHIGNCGICKKLGRKCPFGLDGDRIEQQSRPASTQNRPTSSQQIHAQPSVMRRSILQPTIIPVYPVFQVCPVYYNVTVPIKLSKARLANSTINENHDILVKENVDMPKENKMKHSASTFDRSKMKQSLMSNRSKKGEPLSPE